MRRIFFQFEANPNYVSEINSDAKKTFSLFSRLLLLFVNKKEINKNDYNLNLI